MPWMSELAQLPMPAIATRMGVMSLPSGRPAGLSPVRGSRRVRSGAFGLNQTVEPVDVLLDPFGGVFADRARVGVKFVVARGGGLGEVLHQLGPATLEQGQAGLRLHVAGERKPEREAPSVIGGGVRQPSQEELPPRWRDPVHLAGAAPAGPGEIGRTSCRE